jgi:hypothetical protein
MFNTPTQMEICPLRCTKVGWTCARDRAEPPLALDALIVLRPAVDFQCQPPSTPRARGGGKLCVSSGGSGHKGVNALFSLYKQQLSNPHIDENRPLHGLSGAKKRLLCNVLFREGTHRQYSRAASHTYRGRELWFEGWRARVRCPRLYSGASHRAADASSTLPRYLAAAAAATPLPL